MNTQSFDLPDPHYQPEFYADVPLKRLISWAIDTVIIVLLVVLILPFTAFTGLFFLPLLAFLVNFAYRVICLANGSATLGMRLTAIEFRTRDGARFEPRMRSSYTLAIRCRGCSPSRSLSPLFSWRPKNAAKA